MTYDQARLLPVGTVIICVKPDYGTESNIPREDDRTWCPIGTKFKIVELVRDGSIKVSSLQQFSAYNSTIHNVNVGNVTSFTSKDSEWDCYEVYNPIPVVIQTNRLSFL